MLDFSHWLKMSRILRGFSFRHQSFHLTHVPSAANKLGRLGFYVFCQAPRASLAPSSSTYFGQNCRDRLHPLQSENRLMLRVPSCRYNEDVDLNPKPAAGVPCTEAPLRRIDGRGRERGELRQKGKRIRVATSLLGVSMYARSCRPALDTRTKISTTSKLHLCRKSFFFFCGAHG